jgi:uncharacterized protein involved in exopolysaccharide biosynthesis
MSDRSRHRNSPRRQLEKLFRRHRPAILTVFAAAVAVIAALMLFTKMPGG